MFYTRKKRGTVWTPVLEPKSRILEKNKHGECVRLEEGRFCWGVSLVRSMYVLRKPTPPVASFRDGEDDDVGISTA